MGLGASIPKDVHVVIVGGGYGGTELALGLKKAEAKYTLIDRTDSFQHTIGAVRAIAEEGFAAKTYIPYKDTFGDNFVQGTVVRIDPENKHVFLEDSNDPISYDILVIATGGTVPFPAQGGPKNKAEAVEEYNKFLAQVKEKDRITVVGGGPVGIEICGELATDYPTKKICLIQNREWLVSPDISQKFQKRITDVLGSLHVEIIYGQEVTNLAELPEEGPFKLMTANDAIHYEADMVINCTGPLKVNSEAYSNGLGDSMDERARLKVNECLQVEGHEDIFAIGDCTNLKETKLAYLAMEHAKVILESLKLRAQNKALKKYTLDSKPFVIGVTVGRNNGLWQSKMGFMLPEFILKAYKSKDMMAGGGWKRMDQQLPA